MRKLFILLIFICLIIQLASAITIEEQASIIHNNSVSDKSFVNNVNLWIYRNIKYTSNSEWTVNSTDITWENRFGDCSEMALLGERMMKPYIDAYVVYGMVEGKGLHDTVRVHYDKYTRYMDHSEKNNFTELGIGLHPKEILVTSFNN